MLMRLMSCTVLRHSDGTWAEGSAAPLSILTGHDMQDNPQKNAAARNVLVVRVSVYGKDDMAGRAHVYHTRQRVYAAQDH